jgi:hypothetical protein
LTGNLNSNAGFYVSQNKKAFLKACRTQETSEEENGEKIFSLGKFSRPRKPLAGYGRSAMQDQKHYKNSS